MEAEPAIIAARWVIGTLIFGGITSYTAYRKGYSFGWWFLGAGCLALLIIAYLPNTKTNYMAREQKVRWRKIGNLIGIILTSIVACLYLLLAKKVLSGK